MPKKKEYRRTTDLVSEGRQRPLYNVTLMLAAMALVFIQSEQAPCNGGFLLRDSLPIHQKPKCSMAPLSPLFRQPLSADRDNDGHCPSPSFVHKGAVFVFFHLAKTGGTTVRTLFAKLPSTHRLERTTTSWADIYIGTWLTNATEQRNLFVEFHDAGNPSVQKLKGYLEHWRRLAAINHKPLFIFTVVREPVSYALSYFTYMNVGTGKYLPRYHHWDGTGRVAELTNEDLLYFSLPSPQCLYYSRGELATTAEFSMYGLQFDPLVECPEVYDVMTNLFDWIGTLEDMQQQLLPLLSYLASNDPRMGLTLPKTNTQGQQSVAANFSRRAMNHRPTMDALQSRLQGDKLIYEQVKRNYQWASHGWGSCWNSELQ